MDIVCDAGRYRRMETRLVEWKIRDRLAAVSARPDPLPYQIVSREVLDPSPSPSLQIHNFVFCCAW